MSDGTHSAYRHLYTVAAEGSLGHPGFQTVGCSPALEPVLTELERRVGGFKNPDGRQGTSPGIPSRQLVRMGDPDFYALTTFTPLGKGPDGRDGSYCAETLVVPAAWLADGGWDAAAALDALPWRGPQAAQECTGWPCPLEAQIPLPAIEPTPPARLARLREGVAKELLAPLVEAVARLTRQHQPVRVVEAPGGGPVPLAEIVTLLPLVVPPACRLFQDEDVQRTFHLCTRSHPDAPLPVDLAGLPSPHLEAATGDALVVDLGERHPLEAVRGRFARDYAAWFREVLTKGDWQLLAAVWRAAERAPGVRFFDAFPELLADVEAERRAGTAATAMGGEAVEPPAEVPGDAAGSLVGRRRAVWTSEAQVEAFLARLQERRRQEQEELQALLQQEAAHSLDGLRDALAAERREMVELLAAERRELVQQLGQERETAARELRRTVNEVGGGTLESLRREAAEIRGAARDELEQRLRDLQRVLSRERVAEERRQGRWWTGRTWLTATVAAVLAVLVTVAAMLAFGHRGERVEPPARLPPPAGAPPDVAALAARGPVAAALLTRAAGAGGDGATRDAAATLYLDLLLDEEPPQNPGLGTRLLQAALGITADGQFGPGTVRALDTASAGTCCSDLGGEQSRGFCFLGQHLEIEDHCNGASPFSQGRVWSAEQAALLLSLIRTAADDPAVGDTYRAALRNLDLAVAPQRAGSLPASTPDSAETAGLVRLARAVAGGRSWRDVGGAMEDAEAEAVATLLRDLAPAGDAPGAAGP